MEAIQTKVEEAGKKFQEVVETLGKAYLAATISGGLRPVIEDGIASMTDDLKSAAGVEVEDEKVVPGLAVDPNEKEKDAVLIHVDSGDKIATRYATNFVAYATFTIRIGNQGDEGKKAFYVNGKRYRIRYPQLARVPDLAKKDNKDAKIAAFPAPYKFAGTCCFCIKQEAGDFPAHMKAVQDWFSTFQKENPYVPAVADFFNVGDDYEKQQMAREIFLEAYNSTKESLSLTDLKRDVEPFDEVEALVDLLQAIADRDILPGLLAEIPESPIQERLKDSARSSILAAVDKAAGAWGPLSDVAKKAGVEVAGKVQSEGEKILEAFKPLFEKALALIQDKLAAKEGGDDEGDEKEEKGSPQIGDVSKLWQFNKEAVGKKLWESILASKPSEAINGAADDIKSSLERGVRTPLEKIADSILGDVPAKNPIKKKVAKEIKKITNKVVATIIEITTLDGFMEASKTIAQTLDKVEEELKDEKSIDLASTALWHSLTAVGMQLYTRIWKLSEKVKSKLEGLPEEAVDIVVAFLDTIFEVQIRAFNSIRIQYIRNLRTSFAEAKDKKAASREAFRTALFSTVDLLGHHHWTKAVEAFQQASVIVVQEAFRAEVWPSIAEGLAALQDALPEDFSKLGLNVEPLAWAIVKFLIQKGVEWLIKKIFFQIESAVFRQAEESSE